MWKINTDFFFCLDYCRILKVHMFFMYFIVQCMIIFIDKILIFERSLREVVFRIKQAQEHT